MDHDRPFPAHGARHASRHLHRRFPDTLRRACRPDPRVELPAIAEPRTLVSLGEAVVRRAGMLELLAAEMRIAELEAALAEARADATTDSLTGLLNRRGLEQAFERECERGAGEMTLAMLDLDDFKQINDRFGHQGGDEALVRFAWLLRTRLRLTDITARPGGEEFVLLFPETSLAAAGVLLADLQAGLRAQDGSRSQPALTFSGGLVLRARGESLPDTLRRADAAVYAAKRAGKDRVLPG